VVHFSRDREVVLAAVAQDGYTYALSYTSEGRQGAGMAVIHASAEVKGHREVVLAAENGYALSHASEELWRDEAFLVEISTRL